MTSRLRVVAALLALGALGLLLGGCGGGSEGTVASGEPIAFEELAQAARTSADATSGRFAFSLEMSMPGVDDPFGLSGEGAFDAASERAALSIDMSSFATLLGGLFAGMAGPDAPDLGDPDAWRIDVVQDGTDAYVRFPALDDQLPEGKSWVRGDERGAHAQGIDFSELEQFTRTDPRELLDTLEAVSGEIETVGVEQLRGVETTHYRATIDPARYAELAPKGQHEQFGALVDEVVAQSGLGKIPVDVWLDGSGLVRKVAMGFSATQPGTTKTAEASVTFELFDYGEQVEIDVPPAEQVVDASALKK
jgi:hypothetical protein